MRLLGAIFLVLARHSAAIQLDKLVHRSAAIDKLAHRLEPGPDDFANALFDACEDYQGPADPPNAQLNRQEFNTCFPALENVMDYADKDTSGELDKNEFNTLFDAIEEGKVQVKVKQADPPNQASLVEMGEDYLYLPILWDPVDPPKPSRPNSVVFIHGYLCQCESSFAYLAQQINKAGYRVYMYDMRGSASNSGAPAKSNFTLEEYAQDVARFIAKLEKPPIVIGHSLGGTTALRVAALQRHRISALILLDPTPPDMASDIRQFGLGCDLTRKSTSIVRYVARRKIWNPFGLNEVNHPVENGQGGYQKLVENFNTRWTGEMLCNAGGSQSTVDLVRESKSTFTDLCLDEGGLPFCRVILEGPPVSNPKLWETACPFTRLKSGLFEGSDERTRCVFHHCQNHFVASFTDEVQDNDCKLDTANVITGFLRSAFPPQWIVELPQSSLK